MDYKRETDREGDCFMKGYIVPNIDVLLFDEDDDILTASTATYAAKQLNEYMYGQGVKSTTTIKLQDVEVTSE